VATRPTVRVSAALLVVGASAAALTLAPAVIWHLAWPLAVLVPAGALVAAGLGRPALSGLLIPGVMLATVGLLLAVQNATGLWATWAYAWTLVAPLATGVGIWLQGRTTGSARERAAGVRVARVGALLFAAFGAFFEGVVHLSQPRLGLADQLLLPAALVVAGGLLLARRLRRGPAAG
jgi:hypothetical protein